MTNVVMGAYRELNDVQQAVDSLTMSDIPLESVSVLISDPEETYTRWVQENPEIDSLVEHNEDEVQTGEGAAVGALAGLAVGLATVFVPVMLPTVGPIVTAGPLVTAITGGSVGAAAGATTGALVAGLVDMGIPEGTAGTYLHVLREGGSVLAVEVTAPHTNATADIMQRFNAIEVATAGDIERSTIAE